MTNNITAKRHILYVYEDRITALSEYHNHKELYKQSLFSVNDKANKLYIDYNGEISYLEFSYAATRKEAGMRFGASRYSWVYCSENVNKEVRMYLLSRIRGENSGP